MNNATGHILNTLIYGDIFKFPLKISELQKFLISPFPVSREDLEGSLKGLCAQNLVENKNGFCFLPGRENFIRERLNREAISKAKLNGAKRIIKFISFLPFVKMVGLTGDLSYGNGGPGSDVDLMIVTSTDRMWLTRMIIFSLLEILGLKMNDKKRVDGTRICVNVWCDENNLRITENEHDLVLASDVVHLIPLVNKESTYEKFISSNLWLKNYFPNWNY